MFTGSGTEKRYIFFHLISLFIHNCHHTPFIALNRRAEPLPVKKKVERDLEKATPLRTPL